jgi:hypothetical protein
MWHFSLFVSIACDDEQQNIQFLPNKRKKIRPLLGGACDPTFWQLEEMFQIRIRVFELILVFFLHFRRHFFSLKMNKLL